MICQFLVLILLKCKVINFGLVSQSATDVRHENSDQCFLIGLSMNDVFASLESK